MTSADDITPGEITRCLARMETKIDAITADHEQRLRRAEHFMYVAIGLSIAGAATGVGSMLASVAGGAGQ